MKKIIDYTFAFGYGAVPLMQNVWPLIKDGWQPLGAAQHVYFPIAERNIDHPKAWESYQTLVKYEE